MARKQKISGHGASISAKIDLRVMFSARKLTDPALVVSFPIRKGLAVARVSVTSEGETRKKTFRAKGSYMGDAMAKVLEHSARWIADNT